MLDAMVSIWSFFFWLTVFYVHTASYFVKDLVPYPCFYVLPLLPLQLMEFSLTHPLKYCFTNIKLDILNIRPNLSKSSISFVLDYFRKEEREGKSKK